MVDTSTVSIANLLYRYAELMDLGDFGSAAELFAHARIKTGRGLLDDAGLLNLWRKVVKLHPDGKPHTKHIITNPIVEVDEAAGTATCRSYYTVLQATDTVALQVIAAGRYHDEFECVDGQWRFSSRAYSLDLTGDIRDHMTIVAERPIPE